MDVGSIKLEEHTVSLYVNRLWRITHIPISTTFRPASGESTGVPPLGSIYGILTCFDNWVNRSMVARQMIIPTVIPKNGKPPSWKGKWFCSTNTTGNASKKKLSGGQILFRVEKKRFNQLYYAVRKCYGDC